MQHPRIFGRGHIGRGRTNIAPEKEERKGKRIPCSIYIGTPQRPRPTWYQLSSPPHILPAEIFLPRKDVRGREGREGREGEGRRVWNLAAVPAAAPPIGSVPNWLILRLHNTKGAKKMWVAIQICGRILAEFFLKGPKRGQILKMFCFPYFSHMKH
jgi:hypothetical protein